MYRSSRSKWGYIATGTATVEFKITLDDEVVEELNSIEDEDLKEERLYEELCDVLAGMDDADDIVESDSIKIKKDYIEDGKRIIEGQADVHARVYVSAYDLEGAYEAADEEVFSNESIVKDIIDSEWSIDEDEPDWEQD